MPLKCHEDAIIIAAISLFRQSLNLRLMLACDFISSHAPAGAAAVETSSESEEEEEEEQRPESITDLSLEYLQIKKLVKYMKVDALATSIQT